MTRLEAAPLDALEYRDHLASLLGETTPEADATPVLAVADLLLRLAITRESDCLAFHPQESGALAISYQCAGVWNPLPAIACRGALVSRLFVIGGLEKGEEARVKPQRSRRVLHGTRMVFETEPLGMWLENLRIHLLTGSFVCSGCYSEHRSGAIHVVPAWSEGEQDFLTAFRCDRCWNSTLDETRRWITGPDQRMWDSLQAFLERHGCAQELEAIRTAPLADAFDRMLQILDEIESGRLDLDPR